MAKNDRITWDYAIGSDAELLALAKQAGSAPGQTKRSVFVAVAVVVVLLVGLGGVFAGDVIDTLSRAVSGKKVRAGAMVIKTRPAGAKIILDGVEKGMSNLKLVNIDPDEPHRLEVQLEGEPLRVVEIAAKDFVPVDGMPTYTFEQDPPQEVEVDAGAPEVDTPPPSDDKKAPKRRRGRRSRK